jgi:hypothetical protein
MFETLFRTEAARRRHREAPFVLRESAICGAARHSA